MWNQIPPIQSLKLFDTVVRYRSMTRAAAEAGVSQSAVSQSIRQLEDFLQAPLLDRTTRPMRLTPAGEEFHRICIEGLGRLAHAVDGMRQVSRGNDNALTVSCNLGFATYWLMPRLNYFSAEHPDVEVHVMVAYQGAAGLHDDSNVAIRFGDGNWPDGSWQPLFSEALVPICAPIYAEKQGQIKDFKDLASRRLVHVEVPDRDWLGWDAYFRRVGFEDPTGGGLRFGNYVQAVQAALAGDGVMLGWRAVVGDLLTSHQLTVAFDHPVHLESGYFVRSRAREDQNCVKVFLEWLQQQAGETAEY